MTLDEARTRVALGAAHLDAVRPAWWESIDVGVLTLHDACGCVLGQLFGPNFIAAARVLFTETEYPGFPQLMTALQREGFDLDSAESDPDVRRRVYQPLQDAWLEAIAERLFPAQPKLYRPEGYITSPFFQVFQLIDVESIQIDRCVICGAARADHYDATGLRLLGCPQLRITGA